MAWLRPGFSGWAWVGLGLQARARTSLEAAETSLLDLLPPPSLTQNIPSCPLTSSLPIQPPSEAISSLPVLLSSPFLFLPFLIVPSILHLPAVPCFQSLSLPNALRAGIVLSSLLLVLLSCCLFLHLLEASPLSTATCLCPRALRLVPRVTAVTLHTRVKHVKVLSFAVNAAPCLSITVTILTSNSLRPFQS